MTTTHIITEGSTYDEALLKGLESLSLKEDQVEIEILEEKKGFLFKKGSIKLKLTPLSINTNDETLDNCMHSNKKKLFFLDYLSDGVYLNIVETSEIPISSVLDFLTKKQIKDYDYQKIKECLDNKDGSSYKIAPYQDEFLIDSTLHIKVSNDKLEASISVTEPSGGKILSITEIIDNLNKNGIRFGIISKEIENIVNNNMFEQEFIVARGTSPINGEDGKIVYNITEEKENKSTVIEEDGKIDYKNLNNIRNVKKDTLLMEIAKPTKGIDGIDIYGSPIISKIGKDVIIKKGKNVVESEDGLKIYAAIDGEVHFIDGTIHVDEVINFDRDIDIETGNIQFNGKVVIKGNVKSGFKVEAEGDIEIGGVVEGATLISKGNITIHRGVQGNNQAYIESLGNLNVKYIENTTVKCGGSVEAEAILHSDITTKERITALGKKGLIVGGNVKAGQEIRAKVIGSNMGTITKIEVGINPKEKENYEKLKAELLSIENNMDNSRKAIDLLDKMSKKQALSNDKQELLIKSLKTYKVLKAKQAEVSEELQQLIEKFQKSSDGKIHAISIIYPGVKAVIGSNSRQIYDELSNCTLSIKNAEIFIGPYEK